LVRVDAQFIQEAGGGWTLIWWGSLTGYRKPNSPEEKEEEPENKIKRLKEILLVN
jgi:hypothetical protein